MLAMYYIYVLYSKTYLKFYIGSTSNLEGRLQAHNHPANKGWTKSFQPWVIIYNETFNTKSQAMAREKQLKSAKGREFIKNIIHSRQW